MRFDAVVIGAGHNGLTAAAYLARGGLSVAVLERRGVIGGACVTEPLWPGYRISRAAYVAGLLRPVVVRDLDLHRRGLRLLRRSPSSFTPLADGRSLLMGPDAAQTHAEIASFSSADAARYPQYEAFLDRIARALEPQLDAPPPRLPLPRLRDLPPLLKSLAGARHIGRDLPRAAALLLGPARPVLEQWFESEPLRSTLATDALIGAFAKPSSPGTGYVLFHHVMGETGGARGVWAYVEGGMGALSLAIAEAARASGVEIRTEAPVSAIRVQAGRATGVVLEDGSEIEAGRVLSSADPHRTFLALVGRDALDPAFVRDIEAIDFKSPVVKINLALDRLPRFASRPSDGVGPHHVGTIHVGAADLDALEVSHDAAARGELPQRPMVELTLPSSLDRTLAPEGHHVASLFVQHVPPDWSDADWAGQREHFCDRVLSLVDEVAPGFSQSVLHRDILAPPDLERIFALTGGNIFHGAMTLDRLAFLRPVADWGHYRTPITNLYLCGAGTHPGGGVMAACGRLAAQTVLEDHHQSARRPRP